MIGTCHLLHLTASEATLRERVRRRAELANAPSDADERILQRQLKTVEPLTGEEPEGEELVFVIEANTEQPDCWGQVIGRLRL